MGYQGSMSGHERAYHQVRWLEIKAVPEYKVGVSAGSSGHNPKEAAFLGSGGGSSKRRSTFHHQEMLNPDTSWCHLASHTCTR